MGITRRSFIAGAAAAGAFIAKPPTAHALAPWETFTVLHRSSQNPPWLASQFTPEGVNSYGNSSPYRWHKKVFTDSSSLANFRYAEVEPTLDGPLRIYARKQPDGRWNSGWISGNWSYTSERYVEVRAALPGGSGPWSAPAWEWEAPYGATALENDICEQLGREPNGYHTTLHATGGTPAPGYLNTVAPLLAGGGFHLYGASVHSAKIDFYFDRQFVRSIPKSAVPTWGFHSKQFVLNSDLRVGGWGAPVSDILGPEIYMEVESINVWTR